MFSSRTDLISGKWKVTDSRYPSPALRGGIVIRKWPSSSALALPHRNGGGMSDGGTVFVKSGSNRYAGDGVSEENCVFFPLEYHAALKDFREPAFMVSVHR